jgi:FKBP12-rapamycin complex-associated protein
VSRELMKVAITPQELWYDGLEQAAQSYIDAKDISSMMHILRELHDTMNEQNPNSRRTGEGFTDGIGKIGTTTLRDVAFRHAYGKLIQDAHYWIEQFRVSGRTVDLHQAWEIYHQIFRKVRVQINSLKKLELHHVSVLLMDASNWSLAVPGTYKPGSRDICISGFSPSVHVISSKQRPRRMSVLGSDGTQYQFLLKGHEDLRQDERVMQLFGLINICLHQDRITSERGLSIVRYSVLPLSNNSGLIGWVENCDTMNQLVKSYRESKDIPLYIERILLERNVLRTKGSNPNYDKLPLIHKVELFRNVLSDTTGEDLNKMLWLKSKTSDVWIERRANFTKSLAVMSMAGYILGLGDRHPSNLMVDRISGQVVHIDFGDCFEITAHRSKFPEIIPFRLTRMLTNCMESAGVQGTYRLTCERVSLLMNCASTSAYSNQRNLFYFRL